VRVSDARPITNITDYVCGNCWNSFSRSDSGVVQGDRIVCPHCGHEQTRDGGDWAEKVRNAPSARLDESDAFPDAVGFDDFDVPGIAARSGLTPTPSMAPVTAAAPISLPSSTGYVAGDDELDVDVSEHTPVETRLDDLLAETATASGPVVTPVALRGSATEAPAASEAAAVTSDDDLARQLAAAFADADEPAAPRLKAAGDAAPLPPVATDTVEEASLAQAEVDQAPVELVDRDWKLKSSGLTYNFHGLEALLTWAANKTGRPMAVSINNGDDWKDFYSFYAALSNGQPAQAAYEEALGTADAPAPQSIHVTARMARLSTQQVKTPPPELRMPDLAPMPSSQASAVAPAAGLPLPSASPSQEPSPSASLGPATSPSRALPTPAAGPARTPSKPSAQPAVATTPSPVPARKSTLLVLGGVLVLLGLLLALKLLKVF
jgi:DNA-directed RNA polymerase subunit RPC12/RpoP